MVATAATFVAGCSKSTDSFDILSDSADFKQEAVYVPKKIDILWVVDNSGSMKTSQDNLASNFQSFISRFQQYNYDFHMAVVTTDGWEIEFYPNDSQVANKPKFRDGAGSDPLNHSGVFVMDKNTPNLSNVFSKNIRVGTNGSGDERAFESLKRSLTLQHNIDLGFRRPDAFLAVIIVSDEEDFSHNGTGFNETYTNSGLRSVQSYVDFLDNYTGGIDQGRNYSVSTISALDAACRDQLRLNDPFPAQKIGLRYMELADKTSGVKGSLCGNFGDTLTLISDSIIQLSTVFKLSREPIPESIVVTVDGAVVPNNASNGWTYNAADMTIQFNGSAVPGANASVKISFDPAGIKE